MFCVAIFIACDANYVFESFCLSYDANGATQIVLFLLVKIHVGGALVVSEGKKNRQVEGREARRKKALIPC